MIIIFIISILIYNYTIKCNNTSPELYSDIEINNSKEKTSDIKVYNFNTSWCRYSVMFAPEWSKFESMVENNKNIKTIDVKCDDENNTLLCQKFDVPGFPSIIIEKDNKPINYEGARSAEAILDYIESL